MKAFLAFKRSDVVFTMLINVQMLTIDGILTLMSMINFILGEHDKSGAWLKYIYIKAYAIRYVFEQLSL